MFWLLLGIALSLLALMLLNRLTRHEEFDKIPGPKGIFFLENALDFLMDPVKLFYYFRWLVNYNKRLFKLRLGTKKFIVMYSPEDVEVVISGSKNSRKGFLYGFIKPWLRDGLLLSDGLKWQRRRKILTYAFHFKILRQFHSILKDNGEKFVKELDSEVNEPKTNILPHLHGFSLNSICETAMGTKLDSQTSDMGIRYKNAIFELGQLLVYRTQRVWMYSDLLFSFTKTGRRQKKILDLFSEFRDNVVNKRREANNFEALILDAEHYGNEDIVPGKKRLAMLDLLLQAEKEGAIDATGIGEEVDTFIFEGHDTTATSLLFTFMLLANNQESQDKIVEECEQILGPSTRAPSLDELAQMKYLECCIKESLRLYPPVGFFTRKLDQDTKIRNYVVPEGTDCTILIFDMHRRDDQFVEPLEYRPERFLAEPTWHPYAYIPFSAGPRNCIGQKFAMMEIKLVLSAVLRRYRLLPVTTPRDVVFITDFLLRPRDPIYVKIDRRNK